MRPTGQLHLGHYHGVLKNWVKLQHEFACLFFVADWHALTTHYDDPAGHRTERLGHGDRLAGRRRRSVAGDAVHPVARARARRAAPAAVDDHAAGLAGTRADLQGSAGEADRQGSVDLRLSRLSAAAERRHSDLPRHPGAGGRGPGAAHRIDARNRAPLQSPVRPRAGLRGEGRGGGQEARQQERQALQRAAHALSGAGRRRGAGAGQGAARRAAEPAAWATASACSAISKAAAR